MFQIREKMTSGLKRGDSFTASRTFTAQDVTAFADTSKDYNPIHFDEEFAKAGKFRGRICHGLLVASLLTDIGGQLGWLASEMTFRFRKPPRRRKLWSPTSNRRRKVRPAQPENPM